MRLFLIVVASISGLAVGLAIGVGLTVAFAYVDLRYDPSSIMSLLVGIVLVPVGAAIGIVSGGLYGNHLWIKRCAVHSAISSESSLQVRKSNRKRTAQFMVAIASIIWMVLGFYGVIAALLSIMLFDAPGSDRQLGTIVLAISTILFPITCFASIVASWIALREDYMGTACVMSFLPLTSLALILFAQLWIEHVQGGRFGG